MSVKKFNANSVIFGDGSTDDDVLDFEAVIDALDDPDGAEAGESVDVSDDGAGGGDPDPGGDAVGDDAEGGDDADEGGDDLDAEAGEAGEPSGDEASGDDADAEPELTAAQQKSYDELRAEHNKILWQNQQYQQMLEAQQAAQAQAVAQQPPPPAPRVDASQDPVGAFQSALATGDDQGVQQVISTVSLHAAQFAAQAAQLRADGEDELAQVADSRAMNATNFAEQMRHERAQAAYQHQINEQVTPLQQAAYESELNAAAGRVFGDPVVQSAYQPEHTEQIANYIRQYPQIMDQGPEEGFRVAAEAVIFGGRDGLIRHMVAQQVAEQVAAQTPVKPAAARGGGGGAGRRNPAPVLTPEQTDDEEIRGSIESVIPDGMGILFNG